MSKRRAGVFLVFNRSTGPKQAMDLICALCHFVNFRTMANDRESIRKELVDLAKKIWPDLTVYIGDTHFRLEVNGRQEFFFIAWL